MRIKTAFELYTKQRHMLHERDVLSGSGTVLNFPIENEQDTLTIHKHKRNMYLISLNHRISISHLISNKSLIL